MTPGEEAMGYLDPLIDLMTYEDEFVEETKTLGFMYDKETDTLYMHKGVDVQYLNRLLPNSKIIYDEYHPCKPMKFEYEEVIPPRNVEQEDVINFIAGLNHHADNIDARQIFLVKTMGFGKTYCAGTAACIHGVKTLIIVHRDNLRSQWLKSLYNMNGLTADYTYEITSSDELYDIAYGNIELDYDVYLMTHATFRAGVRRIKSLEKIGDITKNLGIGLKIIDEAHLEFRDTLLMDFCFNVKRNLYLTATDARSAKDENTIFRHVFSHATFYKPSALLSDSLPKKWVEYISVSVNTHVKKAVYQYRIIGGRGMNAAVYGKWVIKQDKTKQHFKCCRDILKLVYVNDPHAKVLIFMPLSELCEEAAYFFRKELNYDESFDYDLNIKTINSSNSKRENEDNKRADVIVTTIGSCGTGTDIPGITTIISCSPFVSRVTALQTFGRIRYCGKVCQYYDIFDQSVPMDFFWLKSRRKKLKSLALNVKHFDWSE